jgi:DDE superfamily endonuclease
MDCTKFMHFRRDIYACFTRAGAALFDLSDALLTEHTADTFIALSQAACFQRRWPSVYAALRDGQIDHAALTRTFVAALPHPRRGQRLLLGLDTSPIRRPDALTAPDRTLVYWPNLPRDATPVVPGWSFSALVVLPQPVSSWTYVLDHQRVPSSETAVTLGAQQLQTVLPLLPSRALLLLDRHYSQAPWLLATQDLPVDQLIRARADQVLYRPAPPRTGKPGAPRKDGARFKGSDPTTHGLPDEEWQGTDARGHSVEVSCWKQLHSRKAREVAITAIRIIRPHARATKRDPREAWFWWVGGELPPLAELATFYPHRFGQEHGYRFDKQDLLWAAPHVQTPEQMQRWTDLVALVRNELVLAQPLVAAERRPWERRSEVTTPRQVRRAMGRLIVQLGTPAPPPKVRGKAPGRARGAVVKRAERYAVIRKTPPRPKKAHKRASGAAPMVQQC